MKKLLFLPFTVYLTLFFGCGYMETKKENLKRPQFDRSETLYLNRSPVDFVPTYFVWDALYSQFLDSADMKEGTLFKIVKKPSIEKNIFTLDDIKNSSQIKLVESVDLSSDFLYTIKDGEKTTGLISKSGDDYRYKYLLTSNDKEFLINGKPLLQKTTGVNPDIIHSFDFEVSYNGTMLCSIFKENYIFKDEYEIIVNRNYNLLDDKIFVAITIFVDQILREEGLDFNNISVR